MQKWQYDTVEFEAEAPRRSTGLQELLTARGLEGWKVVYLGDPEPYTANRTRHERRLVVFMRAESSGVLTENDGWDS